MDQQNYRLLRRDSLQSRVHIGFALDYVVNAAKPQTSSSLLERHRTIAHNVNALGLQSLDNASRVQRHVVISENRLDAERRA